MLCFDIINLFINIAILVLAIIIIWLFYRKSEGYTLQSPMLVETPPVTLYRQETEPIGSARDFVGKKVAEMKKIENPDHIAQGIDQRGTQALYQAIENSTGPESAFVKMNEPIVVEPTRATWNKLDKSSSNIRLLENKGIENPASYDLAYLDNDNPVAYNLMPYMNVNEYGRIGNNPYQQTMSAYGKLGPKSPLTKFMNNNGFNTQSKNNEGLNQLLNGASVSIESNTNIDDLNAYDNTNVLYKGVSNLFKSNL